MFRRTLISCLSGLLICYAPQTLANNFNYNFFEFRAATSPSSLGVEFSSYAMENLHMVARVDKQFNDAFDLAGGAGFNGPFGDFLDMNGEILLHYAEPEQNQIYNSSKEGVLLELNIGARMWVGETMEVHVKIGNVEENGMAEAGVRFHSSSPLSVGVNVRNNGLWGPQTAIDVRFEF